MKTITIILSIILIISCKKEDNNLPITKVSGTVVSTGSQKTVEGVLVYLYDGMPDRGWLDVDKSSHTHVLRRLCLRRSFLRHLAGLFK